jgi:hypothetical protein
MKIKKYLTLSDVKIIAAGCETEALRQNSTVSIFKGITSNFGIVF